MPDDHSPVFARLSLERAESVALLTLRDPKVLNAASLALVDELGRALDRIDRDDGCRALVITGEGRGFCSGANVSQMPDGDQPAGLAGPLDTHFHPLIRKLRDIRVPVVTAVNGVAAGIGMSIALLGDYVVACRSAYFLQAFARIGLVPDGGSTWLLPRLIGIARAKELSLLAERLSAEDALRWGLINRVVDDGALVPEAMDIAGKLAKGPTKALSLIRALYSQSLTSSLEEQLELERKAQNAAMTSPDFTEGVSAFIEKRPARFSGL